MRLHAKIGEFAPENHFLSGARGKACQSRSAQPIVWRVVVVKGGAAHGELGDADHPADLTQPVLLWLPTSSNSASTTFSSAGPSVSDLPASS